MPARLVTFGSFVLQTRTSNVGPKSTITAVNRRSGYDTHDGTRPRRDKPIDSEVYTQPGQPGSLVQVKPRYDNFIGGRWVPPVFGRYMPNISPVNGKVFCEVAKSTAEDVEFALDAAHAAKDAWGATSLDRARCGSQPHR